MAAGDKALGLLIKIRAVDSATGVLRALTGSNGALVALAGTVALASAALVGFGVESVKAAGDFQSLMTKLYTTAGESKNNLTMVGQGILAMSTEVGTGALKLGDAMYWIESAGLHGQKGLDALRVAAQAAKAENANLNDVAIALGASLNAYAGYGLTDAKVMNILVAATGQGMMTMQQLALSLANVLPASAKFHVSLTDVTAALATMTSQGDPAAQAATHLKQMILALEAPSKIGAKALASVGLTSQEVATQMQTSLPAAVQMITDAVGKKFPEGSAAYNQAIKNIAGGNKQMMGFLELSGTHFATFNANVRKITESVKAGGNSIMGWSDVQQNFNFKLDQAKAAVERLKIIVGTALLPLLSRLFDQVTPLITTFTDWENKTHGIEHAIAALGQAINDVVSTGASIITFFKQNQWAMDLLIGALAGLAIGIAVFVATTLPPLLLGFAGWAVEAGIAAAETLATAAPFILVGAIVAVAVAGIILAIQHWGEISTWLKSTWESVVSWFDGAMKQLEGYIQAAIDWFNQWKGPIEAVAGAITLFFVPAMLKAGVEAALQGAKIAATFIASLIQTGSEAVINAAKIAASFIATMAKTGAEAVINAAKVTLSFVASMIKTGTEAVINAAKVTASFIASLIQTGIQGWIAAGSLDIFILQIIASGTQSVIAAAKMTASFIASLIQAGLKAAATAGVFLTTLVPSIIAVATQSLAAATAAIPGLIAGFLAWGAAAWGAAVATIAATWPILLIIAVIGLLVGGFILAYDKCKGFRDAIDSMVGAAKQLWETLKRLWSQLVMSLAPAWESFKQTLQRVWAFLVANAIPIWDSFKQTLQRVYDFILTNAKPAWDQLVQSLKDLWKVIQTQLMPALQGLWTMIQTQVIPPLKELWKVIQTQVIPPLKELWKIIQTQVMTALKDLWKIIQTQVIPPLKQLWNIIQTQVVPVLKELWKVIQAQVLPLLKQLWTLIQTQVIPMLKEFWKSIQPLLPDLKMIAIVVGGIILVAILLFIGALILVIKTITLVIQIVSGVITAFIKIKTAIDDALKSVGKIIRKFVDDTIAFFTHLADQLVGHSIIPDMMTSIIAFFTGLPGRIAGALTTFGTDVINKFNAVKDQALGIVNSLGTQLYTSGLHMIQQFASGITAGIGAATQAARGVATAVANFLHHSTPTHGPLAGDDTWGLEMIHNFAAGMTQGIPHLKNVVGNVAGSLSAGLSPRGGSFAATSPSPQGGYSHATIQVYLDKRMIGEIAGEHITREMRIQAGVKQ